MADDTGCAGDGQPPEQSARDSDKHEARTWHELLLEWMKVAVVPLAVVLAGVAGSMLLDRKQAFDSKANLYVEIMSHREDSDSSLRKDMFNSIIKTFLSSSPDDPRRQVLGLELLAYNFHESLDLGPLFKEVNRNILTSTNLSHDERHELIGRLEKVTREVIDKQVSALEEGSELSGKLEGHVDFAELDSHPEGVTPIDSAISLSDGVTTTKEHIRLEVLRADPQKRELRVRLHATPDQPNAQPVDVVFQVGYFDFPMLDNTRLPNGERCAVALRDFTDDSAQLTLVYFPSSRASLKDKPYYEDLLKEVLKRPVS